jgi:hypothetical protein
MSRPRFDLNPLPLHSQHANPITTTALLNKFSYFNYSLQRNREKTTHFICGRGHRSVTYPFENAHSFLEYNEQWYSWISDFPFRRQDIHLHVWP